MPWVLQGEGSGFPFVPLNDPWLLLTPKFSLLSVTTSFAPALSVAALNALCPFPANLLVCLSKFSLTG